MERVNARRCRPLRSLHCMHGHVGLARSYVRACKAGARRWLLWRGRQATAQLPAVPVRADALSASEPVSRATAHGAHAHAHAHAAYSLRWMRG